MRCADQQLIQAFAADGEVASGSLTSPLVESLVTSMISSGDAQRHLQALRSALRRRAVLLANAINGEQPGEMGPIVSACTAGYFLWVDLRGLDAAALRDRCVESHGVTFLPGSRCALGGAAVAPSHGRVCFAFLEEEELVQAGRRMGRAIAEACHDR